MRNYVSSQEYPYFKTAQLCQILQVKRDGGNYWAAVTGSSSFLLASVILGCRTKMFFSILPFLSCGIPAFSKPWSLPLMPRVELIEWSDENMLGVSLFVWFCAGLVFLFSVFLCWCFVASLAEWFSVWGFWINGQMTASTKPPDVWLKNQKLGGQALTREATERFWLQKQERELTRLCQNFCQFCLNTTC